MPSQSLL